VVITQTDETKLAHTLAPLDGRVLEVPAARETAIGVRFAERRWHKRARKGGCPARTPLISESRECVRLSIRLLTRQGCTGRVTTQQPARWELVVRLVVLLHVVVGVYLLLDRGVEEPSASTLVTALSAVKLPVRKPTHTPGRNSNPKGRVWAVDGHSSSSGGGWTPPPPPGVGMRSRLRRHKHQRWSGL
jgi:hypothetical protein